MGGGWVKIASGCSSKHGIQLLLMGMPYVGKCTHEGGQGVVKKEVIARHKPLRLPVFVAPLALPLSLAPSLVFFITWNVVAILGRGFLKVARVTALI
eukprot:1405862-Amphidinium_carterae.1